MRDCCVVLKTRVGLPQIAHGLRTNFLKKKTHPRLGQVSLGEGL